MVRHVYREFWRPPELTVCERYNRNQMFPRRHRLLNLCTKRQHITSPATDLISVLMYGYTLLAFNLECYSFNCHIALGVADCINHCV